jgi:UDP-galactose transporter B1
MLDLIITVGGIYGCFLTWGIFQEQVTSTAYGVHQEKFKHFIFLNLVQSLITCLVAYIYVKVIRQKVKFNDFKLLGKITQAAVTHALASPFGYASLNHIDYPTLILGKSCKLVPVMLMNIVLYQRRFPLHKYITVALVTVGVTLFMLAKPSKSGHQTENSIWGLGLLLTNLLLDGVTNSTQDQIFREFKLSGPQMMFYMNFFGSLLMIPYITNPWNPELFRGIHFCQTNPEAIKDILLFSLAGAMGQCFIFHLLSSHGSLVLVTVTVTRKMFSIIISNIVYQHAINYKQWLSVALVFCGIILESAVKFISPKPAKEEAKKPEEAVTDKSKEIKANGKAPSKKLQ